MRPLVLTGKDRAVLEGPTLKLEDKQVPGNPYKWPYRYLGLFHPIGVISPQL